MMFSRKKIIFLLLLLIPVSHATAVKLTTDHAEYEPSSSVLISGLVIGNDAENYVGGTAAINVSNVTTTTAVNKTSDGVSFSASITAPSTEANHRYTVTVSKPGENDLVGHGVLKVRNSVTLSVSKDKSEYFVGDSVIITVTAKNSTGDPYPSFPLELRLLNSTGDAVYSESASTNANGTRQFTLTPSSAGDYTVVVNEVYSLKFSISTFTASLIVTDSFGNPSSFFRSGDSASFQIKVLKNGRPPTSSEAAAYTVQGSVTTPTSTSPTFSFSFRNDTFAYDYNITSGAGRYRVDATISSNATRTLYSKFWVNEYKVEVFPVYASEYYSGKFASGENITLAARITNISSGGYVDNASLLLSVYDSGGRLLSLNYSVSLPADAGDKYFLLNHYFRLSLTPPSSEGRYSVIVNATIGDSTAQGFSEFTISSGIVDAYAVSADGSTRKTIFSLDDTVRIKANLYSGTNTPAQITSLKLVSLKDSEMREYSPSSLQYNLTSGIISFSVPKTGGWYNAEILVNGNSVGYASFLAHLYQIVGRPYKNASVSGWFGWNYFGTQDDVLLDVYVYSTSSKESADTSVTISDSVSAQGFGLSSDTPLPPLRPRIKTIGTVGVDSAAVQEDVQAVQKEEKVFMESVISLLENSTNSTNTTTTITKSSTLAYGYSPVGYYGETLNEVQGVKVSVVGIANGRTWEEIDVSRIANGTTDSSGHTTISIPKPQGGWQSGWYTIVLKGQKIVDNETVSDYGQAWFEVKTFWVWAYPTGWKWYFSSSEIVNITVEVRDVSTYAGIANVSVNITDVYQYGSEDGYAFSARRANYTTASNLTNENGTAILYLYPSNQWRNGWYNVQVRAGNENSTDYGWTGFSVKTFDVWGYGVDSSNNYKWTFGVDDNVSLRIFVREPGKYNCWYGGCNVPDINVSVLKVYDTTTWPAKDVTSRLNLTSIRNLTTADGAVLSIPPPAGGWGVGYYYAVIEAVNSTDAAVRDAGNAWFSIRAFDVVAVPLRNGTYSYVFGRSDTVTYNITVCKAGTVRTEYSYNSNSWVVSSCTHANASINDVRISTWSYPLGYQEIPVNVTGNGTPSTNSRIMTIRRTNTTWGVGWYSVNFKVYDAVNPNISQSEYAGFSVRLFDVYVDQPTSYFSRAQNASFSVKICYPGGCDYYYNSSVYSNPWVRKTDYYNSPVQFKADNVYGPSGYVTVSTPTVNLTGTGTYNIAPPASNWTDGWYSVSFSAREGGDSQSGWSWFNVKSFTASGYPKKWQYSASENINITITTKDPSGNPILIDSVGNSSITLMRQPEGSYYGYSAVSGFNVSSSIGSGTTDVVLSSSGWEPGYYYATIPVSYGGATQYVWVSFYVSLFEVQVRTDYPPNRWYFTPSDQIALNVSVCNIGSYNYYSGSCEYYAGNVTLRIDEVYTYDSSWRQVRVPVTASTYLFNGTSRIVLNLSNISTGSYNVQMLVSDSGGRSKRAYGWFEVKSFEIYLNTLSPQKGYFTPTDNLTFNITVCMPGTRDWYYDSASSQWLVNCSTYESPVDATLTSLQRYDRTIWNYVAVNVRNVSVQFTGRGALSINRSGLYDTPLSVGEYYANIRVSATSNLGVYGTTSSWFYVKIFEIVSQPNTPEGYYFLPSENFSFSVKVCSPGTRNETWNSTARRYDYPCVPYSRPVTAELSVSSMYAPVTWAYSPVDVAVNYSQFNGSAILNVSASLLPNEGGSLRRGYYNYRVKISDASDSSVYDYVYSSAYVKHFDATAYTQYTPAVSTASPLNVTVYGYARNSTYLNINVTSVSVVKYDYSTGAYTPISLTGWSHNDTQNRLVITPASAWTSAYYNVRVNMTPLGEPSKVEEAYGGLWVS